MWTFEIEEISFEILLLFSSGNYRVLQTPSSRQLFYRDFDTFLSFIYSRNDFSNDQPAAKVFLCNSSVFQRFCSVFPFDNLEEK